MKTRQEIEHFLAHCYGSDSPYIKSALWNGLVFTQSIDVLREIADCYWLVDAIASYRRTEPFQVWTLKVADGSAVLTMREDDGQPELVRQEIEYTDFPLPEIELWCEQGGYGTCEEDWTQCMVLMIPTER